MYMCHLYARAPISRLCTYATGALPGVLALEDDLCAVDRVVLIAVYTATQLEKSVGLHVKGQIL